MSILANDFFVAAHNSSKRKSVRIKKDDVIKSLLYGSITSNEDLKKELEEVEEIYKKLKGKLTKKKLKTIGDKIKKLKSKVKEGEIPVDDVVEHEGMTISAPTLGDLEEGLKEIDETFNVPKREETEEITPPVFDEPEPQSSVATSSLSFHLLNIPPPPPKN